ncbi:leucine-rich repeat domain-containing protein [Mycoplasma zalophidermidis]|uniref:Leucine-rich repeat domain-containing protein n=1 Tax=Mycoplasma zalophidermidis TaxID=398174 RepID=A0ABS6DSM3_9MOLU|nr:leucine-rich repeat protein [Mycoplasma zalophidermidis]MBU4693869.1 leucine-rich repeat domain-containing protein [Mycoplasma zalophidermidis]
MSISIPNVTGIGWNAFGGCDALASVKTPNMVELSEDAFRGTKFLDNLINSNPQKLAIVSDILIDGTKSSGDIVLPKNVKYIANCAFSGYKTLTSVAMPNVTKIGIYAFYRCDNLSYRNSELPRWLTKELFNKILNGSGLHKPQQ